MPTFQMKVLFEFLHVHSDTSRILYNNIDQTTYGSLLPYVMGLYIKKKPKNHADK